MEASNRQERLQMRQRGAGTRKIDAVDFGISFDPTPRRSARNTPQPASQRRQSRTPSTARGALRRPSKTPSKEQARATTVEPVSQDSVTASARSRPNVYDAPFDEPEPRLRKRRKLSSDPENNQLITPATSQASAPSVLGKRSTSGRRSSALPVQIAEVPEEVQLEPAGGHAEAPIGTSPGADKENAVPGADATKTSRAVFARKTPGTGRSTVSGRKSRSSRSVSRQSDDVSILSATGEVDSENEVLVAVLDESDDESVNDPVEGVSLMTAQGELPDGTMELVAVLDDTTFNRDEAGYSNVIDPSLLSEGPAETPAPRSANIKKKRSSLKTPSQSRASRRASSDMLQLSSEISSQQAHSDLPTPHQAQTTTTAHPASDDSFYQANHEDEDETYHQPTSPVIPTPKTVAKKPRKKKSATKARRSSTSSTTQNKQRKSKPTTFPVLTHRLTNTSFLPTITEEPEPSEDENSDREPNSNPTFTKYHNRPTPNAIDVLAQFCREDIEAALEKLSSSSTTNPTTEPTPIPSRAHLKRTRHTLTSFAQTLESRLFALSTAVEHRLALEARLKHSVKEKAELQARWMQVRSERERVARRIDAVRREKEERERESAEIRALSRALWRVELRTERQGEAGGFNDGDGGEGGGDGMEALEWKLRTVVEGGSVSARTVGGGGAGLAERVSDFNAVLERMVGVLNRRKGVN